jgi:hypothetical protein
MLNHDQNQAAKRDAVREAKQKLLFSALLWLVVGAANFLIIYLRPEMNPLFLLIAGTIWTGIGISLLVKRSKM